MSLNCQPLAAGSASGGSIAVHRPLTILLLHQGRGVGIASQAPAAVGLFAVYRDTMSGEFRRIPPGVLGDRQCIPAPRVSNFADNYDLFQLTAATYPHPLVGGRPFRTTLSQSKMSLFQPFRFRGIGFT
jgi:hypothetical protein